MNPTEDEKKPIEDEKKLIPVERRPPKPVLIQRGMTISFYGCKYKCVSVRPNGTVKLKFKGFINIREHHP